MAEIERLQKFYFNFVRFVIIFYIKWFILHIVHMSMCVSVDFPRRYV